ESVLRKSPRADAANRRARREATGERLGALKKACEYCARIRCSADATPAAHYAAARLAGLGPARGVVGPRVAVFLRLARHQDPVQADGHLARRCGAATAAHHAGFQPVLRQTRQDPVRGVALSGLLLLRALALDVFRNWAAERHQHDRGATARDYQGLFSAAGATARSRALRASGRRDWICRAPGHDAVLQGLPRGGSFMASGFPAARRVDGARRRPVAFGAERHLPRRAIRLAVPGAVLDVRLPGRLSEQPGARALALVVWPERHGGSHRGFSLGADRTRRAAQPDAGSVYGGRTARTRRRVGVFPSHGVDYCRRRLSCESCLTLPFAAKGWVSGTASASKSATWLSVTSWPDRSRLRGACSGPTDRIPTTGRSTSGR